MEAHYIYATITEALVDKVESLKVEVDAQQQVIEALRSERENQGDETIQEKYLADALYTILDLCTDTKTFDIDFDQFVKDIQFVAKEALAETNYQVH